MGRRNVQSSKAAFGAAVVVALGLAGCPTVRRPATPPDAGVPSTGLTQPDGGAARYQVIGSESLVVVLAYRGGPLASFGHNHVIASHALTGFIDVAEPLTASTFELHLPVADFTVDEPALRSNLGAGFAGAVPDSARDGTRHNMLGEDLLDAGHFPEIVVRAMSLAGGPHDFLAHLDINIRGGHHAIEAPITVNRLDADRLQVSARFSVAQSALGLTPFSIMLGALQVEDTLEVEVDLTALRAPVVARPRPAR